MTAQTTQPRRTRLAVFGSVASVRSASDHGSSPAFGAVLERVLESIATHAPAIAGPILDRAVGEGRITRVERHDLLRQLSYRTAGNTDDATDTSPAGRLVLREALAAVRREAPAIARPILDEAVGSERLTAAQEQRILDRLRSSPSSVLRRRIARPASSVS